MLWNDTGNNADSPIGVADGVLVAQNSKSQVLKVGLNGKVELLATDTYTGGALAMTKDGKLYVGERALNRSIWEIQPKRQLFADKKDGEPLECLGQGVLNDMVADSKGGIYMTMGGIYYVNPQGVVSGRFGVTGGNGLILSKDEKTFYATGRLMGADAASRPQGPGRRADADGRSRRIRRGAGRDAVGRTAIHVGRRRRHGDRQQRTDLHDRQQRRLGDRHQGRDRRISSRRPAT